MNDITASVLLNSRRYQSDMRITQSPSQECLQEGRVEANITLSKIRSRKGEQAL